MLKPNGSFKLSKSAKRLIASCSDREQASHVKKMFIDAELAASIMPKITKQRREGNAHGSKE